MASNLEKELEQLAQKNAILEQNQKALVNENNQLRQVVQGNGKLIYKRLLDLKKDVQKVGKDSKNDFAGWNFRGIDQMLNYFKPLMDKHNIGLNVNTKMYSEPKFVETANNKQTKHCNLILEYEFFTDDGSSVKDTVPAEAVATDDKGTAKALSQALKYLLIQKFLTPTEDIEDADRGVVDNVQGELTKSSSTSSTNSVRKTAAPRKATSSASRFSKKKVATKSDSNDDGGVDGLEEL
ncbi:MAG TPA: ERF family protein [Vampirovibrionales bacterium]